MKKLLTVLILMFMLGGIISGVLQSIGLQNTASMIGSGAVYADGWKPDGGQPKPLRPHGAQ